MRRCSVLPASIGKDSNQRYSVAEENPKSVVSSVVMVPVDQINAVTDSNVVAPNSKCPKVGGGCFEIAHGLQVFKPLYRDEYTNGVLPEFLVGAAIC